jgi:hypothetical protein
LRASPCKSQKAFIGVIDPKNETSNGTWHF